MQNRDGLDLEPLRAALRANAGPLAEGLLGGRNQGTSSQRTWRFGNGRGSLAVEVTGARKGLWHDHASGAGGDLLDLIRFARAGASFPEAIAWARGWLGMAADARPPPAARRAPARTDADDEAHARRTRAMAAAIWRAAAPARGTLAERYLAARGLRLPADAPIRFHGSCPRGADRLPAMVALMTDATTNEPVGIHRTFLRADGGGKAETEPQRAMLGHSGVIRLVPDDAVTLGLGLAEGLETALSVVQHGGWRPVWAATSAGSLKNFPILSGIEALTLFADQDPAGVDAARACARRWADAGAEAAVVAPLGAGKDWRDVLAGGA